MSKFSEFIHGQVGNVVKKTFGFRGLWIEPVQLTAAASDTNGTNVVPGMCQVAEVTSNGGAVTNYVVLPALSSVPNGHEIKVLANAGAAFEIRTPAASGEKINTVDSDGTQEYLAVDAEVHRFIKVSNTDGWTAIDHPALGGAGAATIPD